MKEPRASAPATSRLCSRPSSASRTSAEISSHRARRIGILGGTFDPPHHGHVKAAMEGKEKAQLDLVLWVVAPDPWQKSGAVIASAEDRFAMVAALVDELPGHEASRLEFERPGPTYTVDTLLAISAERPDGELHLIVGEDVAGTLDTWHRPDEVRRLADLVVIDRSEGDVSSTEIRGRLAAGEPIDGLTPPVVIREIRERGLYPRS